MSSERRRVPMTRLDRLLEQEGIAPGFELLVIDVEGYEPEVLGGFDLARFRPRMAIIEIPDLHPDFHGAVSPEMRSRFRALRRAFSDSGYEIHYRDAINTVFLAAGESLPGPSPG